MSSHPTDSSNQGHSSKRPPSFEQVVLTKISNTTVYDNSPLSHNLPNFSSQNPEDPNFNQIIDVVVEWQKGNFLPAIHCLKNNLIPKDFIDHTGYNVLHHAVSQNSVPITLLLLDYFKIDANILSRTHQTPLMIACNYGLIEITRILLEHGAQVNEQDDTKFSALLYAAKHGHIPQLAYLIHNGADLQVKDSNGCTLAHWAAYKNHVFLLQVLEKLGLDINTTDFTGLKPLDRAIQNDAFEATRYLLERGDRKISSNLKLEQIYSSDMKKIIKSKLFPTKWERIKEGCGRLFIRNNKIATLGMYAILWLAMMGINLQVGVTGSYGYMYDFLFIIASLYFALYTVWYYLVSSLHFKRKIDPFSYDALNASVGAMEENLITKKERLIKMNFESLDKLVKREMGDSTVHERENEHFVSFLHELAWNFETKNYQEIVKFDEREYCAQCLTRKPKRSAHPKQSQVCVPLFHHYSYCMGQCIDISNHYLYMLLLINQMILLTVFLAGIWAVFEGKINNPKMWVIEAGHLLYSGYGGIYTMVYSSFVVLWCYNFVFLWIELYGISKNVTYYELFNRFNCSYLFKVKVDKRGQLVKQYENLYDMGFVENVKQYVKRAFSSEKKSHLVEKIYKKEEKGKN